ncbi:hypothetical protein TCA2_4624 [Paenibacillus sp. TCA20]|uniref:TMhelix containing protein n=1 Tax=Paenibacillus urinalis TaxID=521520 RepID=A0ABY7XGX8_9BACL|nr:MULTISPECIES: hypothetical protein [Paenibacillus]WDI05042.1 hypothetical protein PUW25_26090 [Paenibacillus urinalis]GAK42132.1 hypothetical protein TCA2_4624 [Paenibacillus sp. TCA20]
MEISKTLINRIRILIMVGIFIAVYHFIDPMWAFGFALYCILVDIADLNEDMDELTEERKTWKSFLTNRKGF